MYTTALESGAIWRLRYVCHRPWMEPHRLPPLLQNTQSKEKLTIQSRVNYCSEFLGTHFHWLCGWFPTWPIFNTFRKMHVIVLPRFSSLCIQTTKDNVNLHDCEIHQMEDKFEKQDGALRDWVSLQEIVTIFTNDQKASWHDWIGQIDRLVWVEYAYPMLDSC